MSFRCICRQHLILVLLLLSVGVCKVVVFCPVYRTDPTRILTPDSLSYNNTAKAFLKTGRFAISSDRPDIPQTVRTPGYPFFIAAIYAFFGQSYFPLIIIQIFISLGTIVITYRLASILWAQHIAVISAFLLSLDLPSFINSQQILADTVFTFVLSCAIFASLYAIKSSQYLVFRALIYGIIFSLATLIRPVVYYIIFPVLITYIILWRKLFKLRWKTITIATIAVIVPWSILVGGWQLRNYLLTGSVEFSTVVGWNLLFCRGAGIIAERDGISYNEARQRLGFGVYTELHPETKNWSEVQLDRRWKHEGLHIITKYPWLFLKSQTRGFLKMMLGTGETTVLKFLGEGQEKTGPLKDFLHMPFERYIQEWIIERTGFFVLFLFAEGYLIIFYVSIVYTLGQLVHTRSCLWHIHLFMWMLITYVVIISISGGPEAYSRFRIPLMPFLSIYAGRGLYQMITRLSRATQ